jgi:hypothetical protein
MHLQNVPKIFTFGGGYQYAYTYADGPVFQLSFRRW